MGFAIQSLNTGHSNFLCGFAWALLASICSARVLFRWNADCSDGVPDQCCCVDRRLPIHGALATAAPAHRCRSVAQPCRNRANPSLVGRRAEAGVAVAGAGVVGACSFSCLNPGARSRRSAVSMVRLKGSRSGSSSSRRAAGWVRRIQIWGVLASVKGNLLAFSDALFSSWHCRAVCGGDAIALARGAAGAWEKSARNSGKTCPVPMAVCRRG